jgi:hypothetical protein
VGCGSNTSSEKVDAGQRRYCDAWCAVDSRSLVSLDAGKIVDVAEGSDAPGDVRSVDQSLVVSDGPRDNGTVDAGGQLLLDSGLDTSNANTDVSPDKPLVTDSPPSDAPPSDLPVRDTADTLADLTSDTTDAPPDIPTLVDGSSDLPESVDVPIDSPNDSAMDGSLAQADTDGPVLRQDAATGCTSPTCNSHTTWDKDVVPYFYGLVADGAGNAWASGTFYGAYDFGTGTTLTALSSDAFLVKYDSTGAAIQQWNFGDAPSNHDQTSSGLAVAHNGNVLVMGSFTAEIDFDSAGSNTGSAGVDFLTYTSHVDYYAAISGASSGTDPTPIFAHMALLGNGGMLLAAGSNPTQDAFAICGKATIAVAAFSTDASKRGIMCIPPGPCAAGTAGGDGKMDMVVAKIDATTGQVIWGRQFGGIGNQICNSVTIDYNGDVVIAGTNNGSLDFGGTTTAFTAPADTTQLVVAKLDGATGAAKVAQSWGTSGFVAPRVAVDRNNNIGVAGGMKNVGAGIAFSGSVNAPYLANVTSNGAYDLFAVKMDTNLTPTCAFADGDVANDQILNAIDFDSEGNMVMAGGFMGGLPNLCLTNTSITAQDVVQLTLNASCATTCIRQYGSAAGNQQGNLISVANASSVPSALSDSIWMAGSYSDTITWDTVPAATIDSGGTGITHNFIARQK